MEEIYQNNMATNNGKITVVLTRERIARRAKDRGSQARSCVRIYKSHEQHEGDV